ncbi:CGNR zinc finger domain-containing protein [Ferrimicrobium acidiphilum]|uniref:CGNR zinc finger domain-containing protein n=1 Tax=Ferrimicrobium acidiphilum TaxID=121039 RepID=UPI0023F18E79|nr:CGNR zinc finger domain-containing protein [Ferrimicrobium acidiphilum]
MTTNLRYISYLDRNAQMAVQLVNALTAGMSGGAPIAIPCEPAQRRTTALSALPVAGDHHVVDKLDDLATDELYRLAAQLRVVFDAPSIDAAALEVCKLLGAYRAGPELVLENGGRWSLHFHSPYAGVAAARGAGCATAFAVMIEIGEFDRFGVCEAHNCDRVFLDASRNGCKRFCSTACMNRTKATQFRNRRREADTPRIVEIAADH